MESRYDFNFEKYTINELMMYYKERKISIPKYQRPIKWNKERRVNLISTINQKKPIGTLLFYKEKEKDVLKVIDGLQRFSAIVDYFNNKNKYVSYEMVYSNDSLNNLIEYFKSEGLHYTKDYICDVVIKQLSISEDTSENIDYLMNLLSQSGLAEDYKVIERFVKSLGYEDIGNYPIMVIQYTGPEENLPDIFHSLNTGAMNLTKYEVISSTWKDERLNIDDKKIIKSLNEETKKKYQKMEMEGFDFNFEGEYGLSDCSVYLFDFCESFSKIMSQNKGNHLFADNKNNSIVFELLGIIFHGKKYHIDGKEYIFKFNSPESINKILNCKTDRKEVKKLYSSMIDVRNELNDILDEFMYKSARSNSKLSGYTSKHIFLSMYKKKYDIEILNGNLKIVDKKTSIKKYKRNIIIRILDDLLTSFWQKNRQESNFQDLIENGLDRYDNLMTKENFKEHVNSYLHEIVEAPQTYSRAQFDKKTEILSYTLHVYFLKTNIEYPQLYVGAKELEFDHYFAKKWFSNVNNTPYSSILNCWVLNKDSNKKKIDKNLTNVSNDILKSSSLNTIIKRDNISEGFEEFSIQDKIENFLSFCKNYSNTLENNFAALYDYIIIS